jgi:hypothetical protein
MHTQIELQQLESTLSLSIQQYEDILDFLKKTDKEIGTASPSELLELSTSLTDLQWIATQTDQVLLAQLNTDSAQGDKTQHLINRREHIVKDILRLNEHITVKASGVKSLLAHEMGKLRNGLSALSGYKQQQHNQGRIVNSTS